MPEMKPPVVVRGETPPFTDLVNFAPLEVPTERKTPGWGERWSRLAPRWQAAIVGCTLVVLGSGAVMIQPRSQTEIVDNTKLINPPPPVPERPKFIPPAQLPQFVIAHTRIPMNTKITAENLEKYFRLEPGKDAGDGRVRDWNTLKNRYAQKDINPDQWIREKDFEFKPVSSPAVQHEITVTTPTCKTTYQMIMGHWHKIREQIIKE